MGSFYTLCSVTNETITDGQEMVVQLIVPSWSRSNDPSIGEMFVEQFLRVAEEKGMDEALASWKSATESWKNDSMGEKGMRVSNDGAYCEWVPVGPAIRGKYDDCGHIDPSSDPENQKRIEFLEKLFFGVPFQSIMEAATDTRWYSLGMVKDDKMWKVEGLSNELPEPAVFLLKQLCVTYIHASVYDELQKFDFSAEGGVMQSKYDIKWKNEYLEPAKEKLVKALEATRKFSTEEDPLVKMEMKWKMMEGIDRIGIFSSMNREIRFIYQACLAREMENTDFEWLIESLRFMYSLSGLCIVLKPSQYGSQHSNWRGWRRIRKSLDVVLESELKKEEEEDEDA